MDLETSTLLDKVTAAHGLASWHNISKLIIDLEIKGNILLSKLQSPYKRSLQITVDTKKNPFNNAAISKRRF